MLSIGTPSKNGEQNKVIHRHLDYATSFGGEIHILYYDPNSIRQLVSYLLAQRICYLELKIKK